MSARERLMQERGQHRAKVNIAKAIERGEAAETPAGVQLARKAIAPLATAIRSFVAASITGKPGRRATAAKLLDGVDPELAAYIAVRTALAAGAKGYTLKATAMALTERLELELIADAFENKEGALYRAVVRNASQRGLPLSRQARAMDLANKKFKVVDQPWTLAQRLHLGTKLVELLIESLGLIKVRKVHARKHTSYRLEFVPEIGEWFDKYNHAATLTRPMFLPTVEKPKPWTDIRGGAYYSPILRGGAIVTRAFEGQLQALQEADMAPVYEGLNGLQETPWAINKRVLAVMQDVWERGLPGFPLPEREDEPLPKAPEEVVNDVRGGPHRKAWRMKMRAIHERNATARSTRFEFARALSIAEENAEHEAIYFPHRLDFRGRAYAASTSLNPQGPDEVRALIHFAEGKELGEDGAKWLAIHGANLFGEDKISLGDRIMWALLNAAKVAECARDPLVNRWWTEADKPWCFLAWCFEWADAWTKGNKRPYGHVSHLPVALDGTCNGIQHFSAMLRDEVGGKAVNLVPADKPEDIYEKVASVVRARLRVSNLVVSGDASEEWLYQRLCELNVDRKITKRAVMVLPYGGTFKSCQRYVAEALREHPLFTEENFGEHRPRAEAILASLVWESIADVVVGARTAMHWLQSVTRVATKARVPLRWTTPTGFVVVQDYRERKSNRIKTRFCGSLLFFTHPGETRTIDRARQCSAVAPNFVHSLDAAAMMLTISACRAAGMGSFAMIHDSYGTHAADTETLAGILRGSFVDMYVNDDVLQNFHDEVARSLPPEAAAKLPPPPPRGSLNLTEVLNSSYFFA